MRRREFIVGLGSRRGVAGGGACRAIENQTPDRSACGVRPMNKMKPHCLARCKGVSKTSVM